MYHRKFKLKIAHKKIEARAHLNSSIYIFALNYYN